MELKLREFLGYTEVVDITACVDFVAGTKKNNHNIQKSLTYT